MIAEEDNNKIEILTLQVWWQSHIRVLIKASATRRRKLDSCILIQNISLKLKDQLIHRWLDGKYGDSSDEQSFAAKLTK